MRQSSLLGSTQPNPAAMVGLPPSPDATSVLPSSHQRNAMPELSLDVGGTTPIRTNSMGSSSMASVSSSQNRLRSVAKYASFHPQVLACSEDIIGTSYRESDSTTTTTTATDHSSGGPSSLGAIAGPRGVALFRTSRPHVPLLIFSHATNSTSTASSISSLEFQPSQQQQMSRGTGSASASISSLYLAAARGSGVLIWDASGHTASPLLGRLLVDPIHDSAAGTTTNNNNAIGGGPPAHHITSIDWKSSLASASGSESLLVTTTASTLSLWDLRALTTGGGLKPSLRFGNSRKTHGGGASARLVQAACSFSDECATIDASGVVSIYDIRMTERGRSSVGSPIGAFVAHEAGVGIEHLPLESFGTSGAVSRDTAWVTWGIETPMASAVVKVWSNADTNSTPEPGTQDSSTGNVGTDEYWYMSDESTAPSPNPQRTMALPTSSNQYQILAQYTKANIACARVCKAPIKNSVVVIGMNSSNGASASCDNEGGNGWWADLLTVEPQISPEVQALKSTFGIGRVAGFQGGVWKSDVKKSFSALLGSTAPGRLAGAELAFSSSVQNEKYGNDVDETSRMELLLCCLSDSGVITTSAILEALPLVDSEQVADLRIRSASPTKKSRTNNDLFRASIPPSFSRTQIFHDMYEGNTLPDVAGMFSGTAATQKSATAEGQGPNNLSEGRSNSPKKTFGLDETTRVTGRRNDMGGFMPLDMDLLVQPAYDTVNTANASSLQADMSGLTPNVILAASVEDADSSARDATTMMENIETARIPCPTLCGVSFGGGNNGRLVIFHNGEVKKMWNWYHKADMMRLSNVPGAQVDTAAPSNTKMLISKASEDPNEKIDMPDQSFGPRSLKDLTDMMAAAKEAQWGETNATAATPDDGLSVLENFFEDESLDSNSSESGDDDDETDEDDDAEEEVAQSGDDMYRRYYGNRSWKGNQIRNSSFVGRRSASEGVDARQRAPLGLSSEMLAPVVSVALSYMAVMGGQSIELAKRWKLGNWSPVYNDKMLAMDNHFEGKGKSISKLNLPHYRDLVPFSPERGGAFARTRSDPNLSQADDQRTHFERPKDEQRGRGSYFSARPNMEESMTFLNKLYSHQKDNGTTFPTLISPPDSPALLMQRYSSGVRAVTRGRIPINSLEKRSLDIEQLQSAKLGVHTIRVPIAANTVEKEELNGIRQLCLHNATVSQELGEGEKEDVWKLFAETVQGQMNDDEKVFNGWGGKGGGALGVDMIAHFFEYYEKLGDIQMLATMFCVLSGGYREDTNNNHPFLLPKGRDAVYDTYIIRYADLLYSWGLLNLRAELNKHLKYPPAKDYEFEFLSTEPRPSPSGGNNDLTPSQYRSGLSLNFLCPKCQSVVPSNSGFCSGCQDYAFRCSICDMAVRGLCTFCETCRHGGHLNHMVEWFSKQNALCPTGCGCQCSSFTTPLSSLPQPQQSSGAVALALDLGA